MSLAKSVQILATFLAISTLVACSNGGFSALSTAVENASQSTGDNNGQGSTTPTTPTTPSAYDKLDMEGYVSGGDYDGNFSVNLDKPNNALIINLPIPSGSFNSWSSVSIPNLPGALIKTYYDSNNRPQVAASIPLSYVLHGVSTLPSASLPNGNALPSMPVSQASTLAFSLSNGADNTVHLYLTPNAVGIYLENSYIPQYMGVTTSIRNKVQTKILGYFTIVSKTDNYSGGLFAAFPLSNDVVQAIADHLSGASH